MPYKNEIAQCRKKVRFADRGAAQAALQRINPTLRPNRPIRTYRCPVCSGWHLTSQKSRQANVLASGTVLVLVVLTLLALLYFLYPGTV